MKRQLTAQSSLLPPPEGQSVLSCPVLSCPVLSCPVLSCGGLADVHSGSFASWPAKHAEVLQSLLSQLLQTVCTVPAPTHELHGSLPAQRPMHGVRQEELTTALPLAGQSGRTSGCTRQACRSACRGCCRSGWRCSRTVLWIPATAPTSLASQLLACSRCCPRALRAELAMLLADD